MHQLVALPAEADGLRGRTGELHGAIGLDGYRGFLYIVFHGEDIHRNADVFAAAQHARQGGHHHERILHRDGLHGVAIGAVVTGDEHHAHAANVLGQLQFQDIGALFQRPGCLEQHHRVEAVVLAGVTDGILVTADSRQRRELPAESADHLVEEVPGLHPQGLRLVHLAPGIRGLEGRDVQQAFIHDGQGIGHGPTLLFLHLHQEGLFRMQRGGHFQHRLQVRGRVLHLHALHAVQAQRKVVHCVAVRL